MHTFCYNSCVTVTHSHLLLEQLHDYFNAILKDRLKIHKLLQEGRVLACVDTYCRCLVTWDG